MQLIFPQHVSTILRCVTLYIDVSTTCMLTHLTVQPVGTSQEACTIYNSSY